MMNLALLRIIVHGLKGSLTFCKDLRHGADGFTSPPKEGVLQPSKPIALSRVLTREPWVQWQKR
jgi:hypothetical protein